MGRRYLKKCLASPFTSPKTIKKRYTLIDEMIKENLYLFFEDHLKYILDLERMHRKLSLKMLNPQEFVDLLLSYSEVKKIILKIISNKNLKELLPDKKVIKKLNEFLIVCDKTFDLKEMKKYNLNDITNSFFIDGKYNDLDKIQCEINDIMEFMDNICLVLSKNIEETGKAKKMKKKNNNKDSDKENDVKVYLKKNDRDGYYLSLTKLRAKSLKNNLKK